jgi:hypothetical protein
MRFARTRIRALIRGAGCGFGQGNEDDRAERVVGEYAGEGLG